MSGPWRRIETANSAAGRLTSPADPVSVRAMTFDGVRDFYPYYLGEHRNGICRLLHVVGSLLVLSLLAASIATRNWTLLFALPVAGYGFAWLGHFGFEKNKPATFKYPFLSLACDWIMLAEILTLRLPLFGELPPSRVKALR